MSKLVMRPSCRKVGQTYVERQACEKPENNLNIRDLGGLTAIDFSQAIQIRDKCMAVTASPPKPCCHTNKRKMYGSQSTQASLSYK